MVGDVLVSVENKSGGGVVALSLPDVGRYKGRYLGSYIGRYKGR